MAKKLTPFRLAAETIQKLDELKAFFGFDNRTVTIKTCIDFASQCSRQNWFSIGEQGINGQKNKQPTGIILLYGNNWDAIQALLVQGLYNGKEILIKKRYFCAGATSFFFI